MKRRDWYAGILMIAVGVLIYRGFPRYEWRGPSTALIRVDRWTGRVDRGRFRDGVWISIEALNAETANARTIPADVNLPVDPPLPHLRAADCTPEAIRKSGELLRDIDCLLAEQDRNYFNGKPRAK